MPNTERVAHREHDVPDLQFVAIGNGDCGQIFGIDFEDRDVGGGIGSDDFRDDFAAAPTHVHLDFFRSLDDVIRGKDVTIGRDDDA